MNPNIESDVRKLIAAANKKRKAMTIQGFREDTIQQQYEESIALAKQTYIQEMQGRIDNERKTQIHVKARYDDRLKEGVPNAVQLELLRSQLKTMTNSQLAQLAQETRFSNSKDTYFNPVSARELGAILRDRHLDELADSVALMCEAVHIDEPHLSDNEWKSAESNAQKLQVCINQCMANSMLVFPASDLSVKQKDILMMSHLENVE
jgi:hypothetical protein